MGKKNKIRRIKGALTCRQGEGHQVGEEVAGEVALALVQRGGHLAADLLRQLGTHHGRDALGRLLGHLLRTAGGRGERGLAGGAARRRRDLVGVLPEFVYLVFSLSHSQTRGKANSSSSVFTFHLTFLFVRGSFHSGTPSDTDLGEQHGQHVLPLEADGQVHQGEAHVERRGAVEELHLVRRELPGDVAARGLVGLHRRQVALHHTCTARTRAKRKEGKREDKKKHNSARSKTSKWIQCLHLQKLFLPFMHSSY